MLRSVIRRKGRRLRGAAQVLLERAGGREGGRGAHAAGHARRRGRPDRLRSAAAAVFRARFMTGGGYRLLASANFGELVLGCIEAKFCK